MAVVSTVIPAITRPHLTQDCWCKPVSCECCGGVAHRFIELRPDNQLRMAVFSDQRIRTA